ncbi:hypothetical protein HMSSN036_42830 [Paenibacillus macerans]|nr:hypothetical protein HMSSN036_42830 [Paenibacillus macerans]
MEIRAFGRCLIMVLAFAMLMPAAASAGSLPAKKPGKPPAFTNVSVHDPSIVKDGGTYYVFGSHIEAAKSADLLNWATFTNGYETPGNALYGDLSENLAGSFAWAGENDSDSKGGLPSGRRALSGTSISSMRTARPGLT